MSPRHVSWGTSAKPPPIAVLKFGSSVLEDAAGFDVAAREIARELERGRRVVAVVSAMGDTTDALIHAARTFAVQPRHGLLAELLATGEDASVALLGIALSALGIKARTYSSRRLTLRTVGPLDDAEPVWADFHDLATSLSLFPVVVMPGFVGRDGSGALSLLGRGGSDLTALYLGQGLGAEEIRLVKDVDGVYATDPRRGPVDQRPLEHATWARVRSCGNGVVQEKALSFAASHGLSFRVAAPRGRGTRVGGGNDRG